MHPIETSLLKWSTQVEQITLQQIEGRIGSGVSCLWHIDHSWLFVLDQHVVRRQVTMHHVCT